MSSTETFGSCLRDLRLARGYSLRSFALAVSIDAGNLSKAERGLLPPPDESTIDEMADALGLSEDEAQRLKDLAVAERMSPVVGGHVKDKGVLIPMLLRIVDRKQLSREELMRLIQSINDNY